MGIMVRQSAQTQLIYSSQYTNVNDSKISQAPNPKPNYAHTFIAELSIPVSLKLQADANIQQATSSMKKSIHPSIFASSCDGPINSLSNSRLFCLKRVPLLYITFKSRIYHLNKSLQTEE
eukprot:TRINITY_DN2374_c0_g1_i4.p1 TRINITY_DN2374_c0_g1~~TRINITY_DN2374_c0_g1_i4.p1  ORF type:complete len:120 (+),score=5.61 TRINITY_DN2374_c0_g1_i4:194-553(+)